MIAKIQPSEFWQMTPTEYNWLSEPPPEKTGGLDPEWVKYMMEKYPDGN